jgi:phosphoglycolate phosphatase-like HAD superfamily hydrolase
MESSREQGVLFAFDLDGTVLNSMPLLESLAVTELMRSYRMGAHQARCAYRGTVGRPFSEQLEMLFPQNPLNLSAAYRFECYKDMFYPSCEVFHDVKETLAVLRCQNIFTALVSSTRQNLVRQAISNLEFTETLGLEPGRSKASQLTSLRERWGRVTYIGDAPYDLELARIVDVRFIGLIGAPWSKFSLDVQTISSIYAACWVRDPEGDA